MIVLVNLPSKCARILYHFSLTKMYRQQRRVMYQNPIAYDLALLFISSITVSTYSRVQKSIENFIFRPKKAIFRRAGMKEGGRVATPTSVSIFDSYDMKSL